MGKTTIAHALADYVSSFASAKCFAFPGTEPGSLGSLVYAFQRQTLPEVSLQLLHLAAHIDNLENRIVPALRAGSIVILDRFWWSLEIYSRAAAVPETLIRKMIEIEEGWWRPIQKIDVFLLRRSRPLTAEVDEVRFNLLTKLYDDIARRERSRVRVNELNTDSPFDQTFIKVRDRVTEILDIGNPKMQSPSTDRSFP